MTQVRQNAALLTTVGYLYLQNRDKTMGEKSLLANIISMCEKIKK